MTQFVRLTDKLCHHWGEVFLCNKKIAPSISLIMGTMHTSDPRPNLGTLHAKQLINGNSACSFF